MNFKKMMRSFGPAIRGIQSAFRSENNLSIHLLAAIIAIGFGYYFNIKHDEWIAIAGAIGLVFTAEYLNTAIEKLTDFVSPDHNQKAGLVKDIAGGAVLVAAFTALVIGSLVFYPYIF